MESKLKQARSEASRKQILEAVVQLIAAKGPGFVTLRSVANETGLSLGAITYHFDSRQAMIVAAYAHHQEHIGLRGQALFDAPPKPSKKSASSSSKAIAKALLDFLKHEVTTNRSEFIASFELQLELVRDAEFRDKIERYRLHHEQMTAALLEKAGALHPSADAKLISAALQSIALTWMSRLDDPKYDKEVSMLIGRLVEVFFSEPRPGPGQAGSAAGSSTTACAGLKLRR